MKRVSWQELRDVCKLAGCVEARTKGDHLVMTKPGLARPVIVKMDEDIGEDIVRSNNGFYPSFDRALEDFRSFAGAHRLGTSLVFVSVEHAVLIGDQLYITAEALQSDIQARQTYELAVARGLGVALGAVGELPDRRLGVYVYGPNTGNEAERLMYPNGLKMTVPERNTTVRIVGNTRMWLLRMRHARRNAARTREYFR